jgi:hypothetical protein
LARFQPRDSVTCLFDQRRPPLGWLRAPPQRRKQGVNVKCIPRLSRNRSIFGLVRHGATERWSNGLAEGQINRLKTLKRAMYGRAGVELLRARRAILIVKQHSK